MKTIEIDQQNEILASLSLVLVRWQNSQKLENLCAFEQIVLESTTKAQKEWLESFCELWDSTIDMQVK